ncbi:MAG TPA: hypothetical protein VK363_10725, partial [Pyrinomonadaceae bacterium]|nr:hypothetical protein [Pyrinomonadaceae bacterium]
AAAAVWCAPADAVVASDEHDCCIAKVGKSNAHHAESQEIQHEATHEQASTQTQTAAPHAGMDCDGVGDSARDAHAANAAIGERGLSCFECCAGGSGQTPATAVVVAPEQTKVKRDAANATAHMRQLFAPASLDISHLAPSQHAPPHKEQRRHILISVFLI